MSIYDGDDDGLHRQCRYVDEVIPHAPWTITPQFMIKHKVRRNDADDDA